MRWRVAIIIMIACCFCARSVHAEAGGTTVAVDGANVTIAVHLDLCCTKDASDETVCGPLIQAEVKAAEDMWNAGLANFAGKGCYNLRVVFDVPDNVRSPRLLVHQGPELLLPEALLIGDEASLLHRKTWLALPHPADGAR